RGKAFPCRLQETVQNIFFNDDAAKTCRDLGRQRHDEAIDHADTDEELDDNEKKHDGTEPDHRRRPSARGKARRGYSSALGSAHGRCSCACSVRASSSIIPRLASSRKSAQI